jgi:signal transduction histidine kinase
MSYGWRLSLAMLAVICVVGTATFYDEQREFNAALQALRDEQVALATAMAADFEGRLRRLEDGSLSALALADAIPKLLGGATELHQQRSRIILVATPLGDDLISATGEAVRSPALRALLHGQVNSAMLSREHGPSLGLPARLVVVGLRRIRTDPRWGVVVLASAERLRTRERHAQLRFLLGLGIATIVVGGFGGLLLRDQKRIFAVARELEVAELQRERDRLLAKADKMATLAALSSGIAHQIATPLGTITGRVEQVLTVVSHDARAAAALGVVQEQVQRIQQTIRGLLNLARGTQPSLVRTDLLAVVRGAVHSVRHRFEGARVQLELPQQARGPAISCDPPILEQALVNLLLNALEASAAGERVSVTIHEEAARVLIVVEDEGHGISDEAAQRVGEPFYTTKIVEQRGTGLGLAIAQEIVANHGGKLSVERRSPGAGTRAEVALPH